MSFWKCMKKTPFCYDQQASHAKMPLSPDAFSEIFDTVQAKPSFAMRFSKYLKQREQKGGRIAKLEYVAFNEKQVGEALPRSLRQCD